MKRYMILGGVLLFLAGVGLAVLPSEDRALWQERASDFLSSVTGAGSEAADTGAFYYTCPMHPAIRLPAPGECPICGMTLVKKAAGGGGGAPGTIWLTDRQLQLSGVRFGEVQERELFREIDTFGRIDYDERRLAFVSAWVGGRIDRLYVDFTGLTVQKGHPLVWLYSPELITAQKEYLVGVQALRKAGSSALSTSRQLVEGTRQKLLWWGLTEEQIRDLERSGEVGSHITIQAPIGGTVIHKNVFEGQYVKAGQTLFRIADLSHVWMYADLYEQQIAPVLKNRERDYWTCPMHHEVREEASGPCPICQMPLQRVSPDVDLRITTQAYPGEEFTGRIAFIDPFLQPNTRTVRIRADIANPDLKLRPDMYARARIRVGVGRILSVPESAVLRGGLRDVVLVDDGGGTLRPVQVELGLQWLRTRDGPGEGSDLPFTGSPRRYHEVLSGLAAGERVVTSAGFLIGSEAQLQGAFEKMGRESKAMSDARRDGGEPKQERGSHDHGGHTAGSRGSRDASSPSAPGMAGSHSARGEAEDASRLPEPLLEILGEVGGLTAEIADVLASDSLEGTAEGESSPDILAGRIAERAARALEELSGDAGDDVHHRLATLKDAAEAVRSAARSGALEETRSAFEALGQTVVEALAHPDARSIRESEGLHLKRCPMVPALWPQTGLATRNPYYGSKMLKCGVPYSGGR